MSTFIFGAFNGILIYLLSQLLIYFFILAVSNLRTCPHAYHQLLGNFPNEIVSQFVKYSCLLSFEWDNYTYTQTQTFKYILY